MFKVELPLGYRLGCDNMARIMVLDGLCRAELEVVGA